MKKFAIILTCALLIGTISGCTTSDISSTSTETSTTTSEKNYPIHFFPVPDGFEAYYHDKKLDVPLSETEFTEKILSIEIERNQDDIKLKADLPLLNSTQIDRHENIKANIEKGALAQLYTEKVEQFFEAGSNKDFSKISDYSDNFFNETQDEITNSTFMAEDMYNMTLKKIKAYDRPLNLTLNNGSLSFVLAGYVDYEYTADYLETPLQHDNNDINFRFIYNSKSKTWLVDQLSTINTGFHELPKPDNETALVIKTF
ncbi:MULTISPECIES: hypothetical protein [unclassified Enterococcus]|uniref:hypothetical protein n=1 Tax=unclassified Enterococcus TaxID=2608891 RepID=UPI0013EE2977|nr:MULTISPECIES: hypothetical protein [unclassified Enterococcus]